MAIRRGLCDIFKPPYSEGYTVGGVACADIAQRHDLPERTIGALAEVAYGLRLTHGAYKTIMEITAGETISSLTASRDLRALVDAKLLRPVGRTRGRYYFGEPLLLAERKRIQAGRAPETTSDPFELVSGQQAQEPTA